MHPATRRELLMARTFNRVLRSVERFVFCSLIAIAVPLNAQQAATTTWTGVVRTAAGQAVPGAKVTVSTMGKKQTAITGSDGRFVIESVAQEPHTVTVQLTGHDDRRERTDEFHPAVCHQRTARR